MWYANCMMTVKKMINEWTIFIYVTEVNWDGEGEEGWYICGVGEYGESILW